MAAPQAIEYRTVRVDEVFIIGERRPVDDGAVKLLAASINSIGLQTPISIRADASLVDPETGDDCGGYELITGRHRLSACKQLGLDRIAAAVWPENSDRTDIQLWEISENLHRADLTKEQRDEHIRRYAELLEAKEAREATGSEDQPGQVVRPEIGYRKPPPQEKGIASKIAEQTGLSQRTIRRALKKRAPVDPEAERERKEAAKRRREQDREARALAAEEYAGWLLSQVDLDQLPTLISWIEASPPRDVIAALRRLSNETPVMDARGRP